MTPTATAKAASSQTGSKAEKALGVGRISRVTGPVVDIEFAHDSIPAMYNALTATITIDGEEREITLEVAQHLGDDVVRAIALNPTDGLVRGQEVRDTGAAISVPVGEVNKGKVFNFIGDVLNHASHEEREVFVPVRETFSVDRLMEMGRELERARKG